MATESAVIERPATEPAIIERPPTQQIRVLGIRVHMVQIPEVVELMSDWILSEPDRLHWVVVADMHAIIEAHKRKEFRSMIETADLTVPDGISLIKVARQKGVPLKTRVTGTDLMKAFFRRHQHTGMKHFFFGDTVQTLADRKSVV